MCCVCFILHTNERHCQLNLLTLKNAKPILPGGLALISYVNFDDGDIYIFFIQWIFSMLKSKYFTCSVDWGTWIIFSTQQLPDQQSASVPPTVVS